MRSTPRPRVIAACALLFALVATSCDPVEYAVFKAKTGSTLSEAQATEECQRIDEEYGDGACRNFALMAIKVAERNADPVAFAIREAANEFGLSPTKLAGLASCESAMNPRVKNGPYTGLFQHGSQYWDKRVRTFNSRYAWGTSGNIYDPGSQARITAMMIRDGGLGPWECSPCYFSPYGAKCKPQLWQHRI